MSSNLLDKLAEISDVACLSDLRTNTSQELLVAFKKAKQSLEQYPLGECSYAISYILGKDIVLTSYDEIFKELGE